MVDRIDEMVEFPLPTLKERSALCRLYFDIMLAKPPKTVGGSRIQLHGIEDQHLDEIALQTEGYSGRAISKLMISIQGHVYSKAVPELDAEELKKVVAMKLESFQNRSRLLDLQEEYVTNPRSPTRNANDGR